MDPTRGPAQRRMVAAASLAAGALIAQQVAGKATRDALFLSNFPVGALPGMMVVSALVSAGAVVGFSAALSRRSPARVVPATLATGTVLLLAEWALALVQPKLAAVVVYLHMAAFGATVVSGYWSLVSEAFDPYTAKRAMGRIGRGASLGGVAGGLVAWGAARVIPLPAMLAVMATLNVTTLLALTWLRSSGAPRPHRAEGDEDQGPFQGFHLLRGVPYLRHLALLVALGAATETLLDYVLSARATERFARGEPLMAFFALFYTVVALLALLAQVAFTRPALRRLGLARTVALKPFAVAAGALCGVAWPGFAAAVLARGAHGVLHNSLFRSGYELLFTPLPERRKRPTKTIIDVGFDKVGSMGAGLLMVALVAPLGAQAPRVLLALAALGAVAAVAIARRLHEGYVTTLEESLRSGVVRLDAGDLLDSTTIMTVARTGMAGDHGALMQELAAIRGGGGRGVGRDGPATADVDRVPLIVSDLRSADPEAVRQGLRHAESAGPALVGHVIPLLARNDVFLDALRALRLHAFRCTGQLLDVLLDPEQDPVVRRRIARVLRSATNPRAVDGLVRALGDAAFDVRRECALTLARISERDPGLTVPREAVFDAAVRELTDGTAGWGHDSDSEGSGADDGSPGARPRTPRERGLAHVFTLLGLVMEREPLRIALLAVLGADPALRGTALEYLETVLPDHVRSALWPQVGARAPAGRLRTRDQVMRDLMRSRESLGPPGGVKPRG